MQRVSFEQAYRGGSVLLTDGAIETRLIYEYRFDLPEFASFLALFRDDQRKALAAIYRSYLAIAAQFGLPMQVGAPTWRAHPDCLKRLGFDKPDDLCRVNREAVQFLKDLRSEAGTDDRVFIAGVIGPLRDGYDPAGAPDVDAAREYHRAQADVLAELGVDLLYAPTFASAMELRGVAEVMASTGLPYMLAPVIDTKARLLDGTPVGDVVREIDAAVAPAPLHYLIGCVHPTRFRAAEGAHGPPARGVPERVVGLKANASSLPPDQLDKLGWLDEGQPDEFAREMMGLRRDFGLAILGGCCGTSDRHIRVLAERVVAE